MIGALDNEEGIRGIHPEAEIYSIRILDENNQTTLSQAVAGIYQAIESDCDILNMSFGTSVNSSILYEAIRAAYDAGILMIAAAGNHAGNPVEYPAAYEEVMAVGATDATGNKISATCDGVEIEILAPGSQVPTSGLFGGTAIVEGTSIAAAQVSGAASLLWAKDRSKSAGFIRSLLENTAQTVEVPGVSGAGLLDIENAFAKYDEMENTYVENVYEYAEIQTENREAEAFEDVELISGSWSGDCHADMSTKAAAGYSISSTNIQLMATAARLADKTPYKDATKLHATDNYVKTVKFLYICANYLRDGKTADEAVSLATSQIGYANTVLLPDRTKSLIKADILSGVAEANPTARAFKVLGFAMHSVGDTFAHRTIVPKYTVSGTNPVSPVYSTSVTSCNARFGTEHFVVDSNHTRHDDAQLKKWAAHSATTTDTICSKWKCFQRTVNLGVMEFRDVKRFSKVTRPPYEDHKDFCKERYADAELSCECLFESFYYKSDYDGIITFLPTEKNVLLNNLKGYAQNSGEDISYWTDEEWLEISTPVEY